MNIQKIKAAGFAIRHRLLGYKLLQNPKGTSPYDVKMMKTWNGIDGNTLDRYDHYYSVSRDFSKPNSKKRKRKFICYKIYVLEK